MGINVELSISALKSASEGDLFYVKKGAGNERYIAVAKGLWDKISNYYIHYSWLGSGRKGDVDSIKEAIVFDDLDGLLKQGSAADVAQRVNRVSELVMNGAVSSEESQAKFHRQLVTLVTELANKNAEGVLDQLVLTGLVSPKMCKGKLNSLKLHEEELQERFAVVKAEISNEISQLEETVRTQTEELRSKQKGLDNSRYGEKGAKLSELIQDLINPPDSSNYTASPKQREKLVSLCQDLCLNVHKSTVSERKSLEKQIVEVMQEIKDKTGLIHVGSRSHSEAVYKKALQSLLEEVDAEAQGKMLSGNIQAEIGKKYQIDKKLGEKLDTICQQLFEATTADQQADLEKQIVEVTQAMKGKSCSIFMTSKQHSKEIYEQARKSMKGNEDAKQRGLELSAQILERMNSGYCATANEKMELGVLCQDYWRTNAEENGEKKSMDALLRIIDLMQQIKGEEGDDSREKSGEVIKAAVQLATAYKPFSRDISQTEREIGLLEKVIESNKLTIRALQDNLVKHETSLRSGLPVLKAKFAGMSLFLEIQAKLWQDTAIDESKQSMLLELCTKYCSTSIEEPERKSKIINHLRQFYPAPDYNKKDPYLFWEDIDSCFRDADELYKPPRVEIVENHFSAAE
jgi:hypothetical protein